jgi:uncharacterized protein
MSLASYRREIPQRYRLEAIKNKVSGKTYFPPRLICPESKTREFEKVILPDTGKIITFTVIRVAPSNFTDQAPYAIAIVELEDGTRITTQVVDCEINDIAIGKKVKIEFRKITEDGNSGAIYYGYKCVPLY